MIGVCQEPEKQLLYMKSNIFEVKKAGPYLGDLQGVIVTVKDLYAGIEERAIAGEKY